MATIKRLVGILDVAEDRPEVIRGVLAALLEGSPDAKDGVTAVEWMAEVGLLNTTSIEGLSMELMLQLGVGLGAALYIDRKCFDRAPPLYIKKLPPEILIPLSWVHAWGERKHNSTFRFMHSPSKSSL
jgi:hypothetical protein